LGPEVSSDDNIAKQALMDIKRPERNRTTEEYRKKSFIRNVDGGFQEK